MLTFPSMRQQRNRKNRSFSINQKGFSLVEILVALFIVAMVYASLSIGTDTASSNRRHLDKTLDMLERGIRFAANESILRGSIVRIKFFLEEDEPYYSIEYGPKDGFVLPDFEKMRPQEDRNEKEQEEFEQVIKDVDKNFIAIEDLDKSVTTFPSEVRILGIGTNLQKQFIDSGSPSFYFYPTGEKDDFLFVAANNEEVASLEAGPFTSNINKKFFIYTINEDVEDMESAMLNEQDNKLKEIYQEWQSDD